MDLSPRLRFKIERWWWRVRSSFSRRSEAGASGHRMCPHCRALIDRDASVCPFCGTAAGPVRARSSTPGGSRVLGGIIPIPSTATSILVAANVGIYALTWYLTGSASSADAGGAPSMGAIRGDVLIRFGAKFGPMIQAGQWWRLVTAMFLHADLLHIGFNLWCLIDLGASVESLFSSAKFTVLYLITGVAGFALSLWWSFPVPSVGASGAILGMAGVLIGVSFHHGGLGKEYRAQLWRWLIYIAIFGLIFRVDNAAHIGGFATGALLGYVVPEGEPVTQAGQSLWNSLALAAVLVMAGSFALMTMQLRPPGR